MGRSKAPIGQRSNIVLVLDIGAFFDQQVTNLLTFWPGLMRDQLHAENLTGVLTHFFQRGGNLDTTTLATATSVDLGFDDPNLAAQGFCCLDCVIDGRAVNPARNRNAEFLQELFALIFVNFHALSLRLVKLRAMGRPNDPPTPPGYTGLNTKCYHIRQKTLQAEIHNYDHDSAAHPTLHSKASSVAATSKRPPRPSAPKVGTAESQTPRSSEQFIATPHQ